MDWLRYNAQQYPHRLCINEYSYEQVYHWAIYTAQWLQPQLENTQRIAVLSDNSAIMAIHMLAAMLLHKEILLLNVHLKQNELENQLQQLGVNIVLCSEKRQHQLPMSVHIIPFMDVVEWTEMTAIGGDCQEIEAVADIFDWNFADTDIAAIMNTSATTGQFKSVPLRWGQIKAHVTASQEVLGKTDDDNWLMVLPLFHVSGLSILMRSLYNGTAMNIMASYDEEVVLKLIEEKRINMMSLVPTILQRLEPRIMHHQLRVILLGGEFIPRPLVDACVAKELPIYKTYGMTETFSQSVTMSVLDNLDKIDSVGTPLPGMKVHIVNPDIDGIGEIHLNGPMLMTGYIGKEPIHGDFNTDDIGYIDDEGYLYILNRRTDLIISGGENIYPKEIEDLLYAHELVKECAVLPVTDLKWGQVPVLFVALQNKYVGESAHTILSELHQYMLGRLAKYKVPKTIHILDRLPRNGTGKIVRRELQELAEQGVGHE